MNMNVNFKDMTSEELVAFLDNHNNHPEALVYLGKRYEQGNGVDKDETKAVELYELAAEQNHPKGMYRLGLCYQYGMGVERDMMKAIQFYKRAVDYGDGNACCTLGECYEHGFQVEKDLDKARELYELAIERKSSTGYAMLGLYYERYHQNMNEALRLYRTGIEYKDDKAYAMLGCCYQDGTGVVRDIDEAVRLYKLSDCQLGWTNLGICYRDGLGVERDLDEAKRLLRKALPFCDAQYHLGRCYETSNNQEERSEAVRLYKLAIEQSCPLATDRMAYLYYFGDLAVEKDRMESIRLYHLLKNTQELKRFDHRGMTEEELEYYSNVCTELNIVPYSHTLNKIVTTHYQKKLCELQDKYQDLEKRLEVMYFDPNTPNGYTAWLRQQYIHVE